ncbi:phage head morphogenesis protein [Clostridium beijerinckii]|uniref:phage head morphogenesis protein n=1 Tax=Clostridium beijerinckii TaxID=1520 RepID=UPI0014948418|nr:phage head morphogenesis protein [Clostridium beijerinckii]NOW07233.1 hypothetical protein [Clostridium beijerinckii]NYC04993.1 hypothetical protein [Clostridium beijerinckii]
MDKNNNDYTEKEEVDFIESLYDDANEQLKDIYKEQKKNKDDILNFIAFIMLTYQISNNIMSLSSSDKSKLNNRFLGMVNKISKDQSIITKEVITDVLTNTVKKTNNFYSGNLDLKDIKKIVDMKFKGEHYMDRISNNEQEIAKKLYSKAKKFIQGETDVNTIKNDIDKTFNMDAYAVKRLAESEVNRSENSTFITIAKEQGVKTVYRHEILDDRICLECMAIDGQAFDIDNAIEGGLHANCRGWNSIYK